ncbi:hypothetical protein [Paenibacillus dauci]|uniref:hypothetical protein n=1 Tax=Paenibacillus dauci TaxID=1567106 RepID=UPI000619896D|nr:hypothetical protein [Paenibacillus dauci]
MYSENRNYPDCKQIKRIVEIGGLTKTQLLHKLQQHSIMMNELGKTLITDNKFTTSDIKYSLPTVELTVGQLGFPEGATIDQIFDRADQSGLALCPLELGPHLRLAYLEQPESYGDQPVQQHRAPAGSVTIASEILTEDEEFPKGFYLRKINGVLWLRGYIADHLHVWSPDDHFIFVQTTSHTAGV